MRRLARFLCLSKGNISKNGAAELAQAECARRGLPWEEPVKVRRDFGGWEVLCGGVWVAISSIVQKTWKSF